MPDRKILRAAEKRMAEQCPECKGGGAIMTGGPDSFVSMPCEACKGTGKRLKKTIDELSHEPDMRERAEGNVLLNTMYHIGAFIKEHVDAKTRQDKPPTSAIEMIKDLKQLIQEYEQTYGEVK